MNPDRDRRVLRAEDEQLLAGGLELVAEVLGEDPEKERSYRALDPSYAPRDTFLVVSGGKVVSHLRMVPREMRVGRSLLRVAVFTDVVTAPDHQGRGHARTALDAALEGARADRYHLALLFTDLPDFFRHQGWSARHRPWFSIDLRSAEPLDLPAGIRDYRSTDMGSLMALHGHCGSQYAGPLLRSVAWWKADLQRSADDGETIVLEVDGTMVGYARARHGWPEDRDFAITDLASTETAGEMALLSALIQRARRHGFTRLTSQGPLANRLVSLPAALQNHVERGEDTRTMLKVINLRRLIRALIPEFEAICLQQGWCGDGKIDLLVGHMAAEITANGGSFEVKSPPSKRPSFLQLSEADFWRLLFDGRLPPTVPDLEAGLLRVLFPERDFAFWRADET